MTDETPRDDGQPFGEFETNIGETPSTDGGISTAENDDKAVEELRRMHDSSDAEDAAEEIGIPEHLRDKHPFDITRQDLEHPDVSEEGKQEALELLPQFDTEDTTDDPEEEEVNLNTVLRVVTGRSDRTPTIEQVQEAYNKDEISDAEFEAVIPEAIKGEKESKEKSDTPSSEQPEAPSEPEVPDEEPELEETEPTLEETGLLDDDDEFPWESEVISDSSKVGERDVLEFRYKGVPFEVWEPENKQQYEDKLSLLENFEELESGKREAQARRFARKLADDLLEIDGHPHQSVYQVAHNGDKVVVADDDGSKGLAGHSDARTVWDAMSWYDRMMIGQRMGQFVHGDEKFRQRRR